MLTINNSREVSDVLDLQPSGHINYEGRTDPSALLFDKMKKTAGNTKLWEKMLKGVKNCPQDLLTSCLANFRLLNMCFLGVERAEIVHKKLRSCSYMIPLRMYNKMNDLVVEKVLFHNILTGKELFELSKGVKKYSSKYLSDHMDNSIRHVSSFIIPKIQQMYLDKKIDKQSIFDYNHPAINSLESEINENRSKVNEQCSFIYHVSILTPLSYGIAARGSQNEVLNSGISSGHAFILEQYYSPKENKDLIYLHQAWIDRLTLAENYYRKGGNKEEASLDVEKTREFFHNLRGMLSDGKNPEFNSLNECQKAYFGIDSGMENITPIMYFRWDDRIFSGVTMRYVTSMIDPRECSGHIDDVIKKYGRGQIARRATC